MNYRHSFHAGNFADIVKHSLLLWLLAERRTHGPVAVVDTHAGAGLYDLSGDAARSREAEAGVALLMKATELPPLLLALAGEVRAVNAPDETRFYPGSPLLVARQMQAGDAYVGFELNPPVLALLEGALRPWAAAEAEAGDGFEAGLARAPSGSLVLIDPPFEQPDDYLRSAQAALEAARRGCLVAVWTPIKDMETFDGFIRRLNGPAPVLIAEARLRPLTNPMKMNGCAMVVLNPPVGCEAAANEICSWVAANLGDTGARAEVWTTP
ncbi:23S rRNA (adenine(2030)-N(6))-methyltransferase RlmJ [Rhizobium sp. CRIBSB]|nr:23S rRNA (adenine(2030)-N(6))-methyltransferase RlmJ [Rhizobium sp. CRIBSB]